MLTLRHALHSSSCLPCHTYRCCQVPERLFTQEQALVPLCGNVLPGGDQPHGEAASFLFDYNLSITEEDVITYAQPFLEQYSFETAALAPAAVSPALSSQTLPVTPRLPSDAVVLPSSPNSSKVSHVRIPQARDRSVSISSLGCDGPFTPCPSSPSPSQDLDDGDQEILVLGHTLVHADDTVFGGTHRVHIVDSDLLPSKSPMPAKESPAEARESLVHHLCGRHRHHFLHMYDPAAVGPTHRCAA